MVEHEELRQRAEEIIAKIPGATTVRNDIVVRPRIAVPA